MSEVVIDKIEVNVPARKEYARLLRLAVAGIASRMDFDYDSLEDVKIGVEEAYLLAVNDPKQERFDVVFEIHPGRLEIIVERLGTMEALEDKLSQTFGFSILHSVMDKVEWTNAGDTRSLRMVKNI